MIRDWCVGDCVRTQLLCKEINKASTNAGKAYYSLVLGDNSGSIPAVVWDLGNVFDDFSVGDVVSVSAEVKEYRNNLQLEVNSLAKCEESDKLVFCVKTRYSVTDMWDSLLGLVDSISNVWCKKLLDSFIEDPAFVKAFCSHSASVKVHHACVGGLLEHTLMVATATAGMQRLYKWLNRDLLVTAAILHDVGKLREITPFPENVFSESGHSVGHVTEGALMIDAACRGIKGFPASVRDKVVHCVLAHHGKLEWGSPKVPAMAEAFVISRLDEIDAKAKQFEEAATKGKSM